MDPLRKHNFHYNLENQLLTDLNLILKQEEEYWKLKSRVQWLVDGDANTRFFHLSTVKCHRRNRILGIQNSVGQWTFDHHQINHTIVNHFTHIYTIELTHSTRPSPPFLFWASRANNSHI